MEFFLEVAKAYNSVPHDQMLHRMVKLGKPNTGINLLHRMYTANTVVDCFNGVTTKPLAVCRGLKQGCPLSPLLYMIYVSGMNGRVLQSGLGFKFQYKVDDQSTLGQCRACCLPMTLCRSLRV